MPEPATKSCPPRASGIGSSIGAIVLITAAVAYVFHRQWLFGERFVGNFDRLNGGSLPIRLQEMRDSVGAGSGIPWSDSVFMGLDLTAHGASHAGPNPLSWLLARLPANWFLPMTALIAATLLVIAMFGVFRFVTRLGIRPLAAGAAAIVYGCSTLFTVRLAQSEGFAYNFVLFPWLFYLVAGPVQGSLSRAFLALGVSLYFLLNHSFLQETAYLWLGLAAFALVECRSRRSWVPLLLLVAATSCAAIAAAPRIVGVQRELALLLRTPTGSPGEHPTFEAIYAQQNLGTREWLRFYADGIFGRFPSEASALGNNINLNEGFQVFSSSSASLLITAVALALVLVPAARRSLDPQSRARQYYAVGLVTAVGLLVLTKPGLHLLHLLFLKMDFSHGRLVAAMLLPLAMLLALGLDIFRPAALALSRAQRASLLGVAVVAAALTHITTRGVGERSYGPARIALGSGLVSQFKSGLAVLTGHPAPLTAPGNGVAYWIRPGTAMLAWKVANEGEIEIEMQLGDGPFQSMGKVTLNRYTIGDISPNGAYRFRLRLRREDDASPYSPPFTPLSLPPGTTFDELVPALGTGGATWIVPGQLATLVCALLGMVACGAVLAVFRRPVVREGVAHYLAAVIVIEAVSSLAFRLNGPQTHTYPRPFLQDNFLVSPPATLNPPSAGALDALHARLERDRFRTVFIEPSELLYSATLHVPMFWNLRTPQGGWAGVPKRLAALPWPAEDLSMRRLIFRSEPGLPWDLLALLNVKYALTVTPGLYFNFWDGARDIDAIAKLSVATNPRPALSRQFFVSRTVPAAPFDRQQKFPVTLPADPANEAWVEGIESPRNWNATGSIRAEYHGDHVILQVDSSPESRFLVMNEIYHPRWRAFANGQELRVYPVDTIMRGLEIPAQTENVELRFQSYSRFPGWWLLPLLGFAAMGVISFRLARRATAAPLVIAFPATASS